MAATQGLDEPVDAPSRPARRRSTARYVVGRVLKALFTVYVVATATFFLVRLLPGNPVDVYINQQIALYGLSYQEAANQAAGLFAFDPNESKLKQYLDYLAGLLRGDLGTSLLSPGTSVADQIGAYLPWTLFSVGIALVISFILGIGIGMAMAYRRGKVFDHAMTLFGSVTHSIPNFLLAMMIIVFFGVQLSILPIAFVANAIRVMILVLVTYHLGDEAGQGFIHGAAGMVLFVIALVLLFTFDGLLGLFDRRMRTAKEAK